MENCHATIHFFLHCSKQFFLAIFFCSRTYALFHKFSSFRNIIFEISLYLVLYQVVMRKCWLFFFLSFLFFWGGGGGGCLLLPSLFFFVLLWAPNNCVVWYVRLLVWQVYLFALTEMPAVCEMHSFFFSSPSSFAWCLLCLLLVFVLCCFCVSLQNAGASICCRAWHCRSVASLTLIFYLTTVQRHWYNCTRHQYISFDLLYSRFLYSVLSGKREMNLWECFTAKTGRRWTENKRQTGTRNHILPEKRNMGKK